MIFRNSGHKLTFHLKKKTVESDSIYILSSYSKKVSLSQG